MHRRTLIALGLLAASSAALAQGDPSPLPNVSTFHHG